MPFNTRSTMLLSSADQAHNGSSFHRLASIDPLCNGLAAADECTTVHAVANHVRLASCFLDGGISRISRATAARTRLSHIIESCVTDIEAPYAVWVTVSATDPRGAVCRVFVPGEAAYTSYRWISISWFNASSYPISVRIGSSEQWDGRWTRIRIPRGDALTNPARDARRGGGTLELVPRACTMTPIHPSLPSLLPCFVLILELAGSWKHRSW